MSKSKVWTYEGPYDSVEVRLPSGRWIAVSRGDEVSVLANEARALKELTGWKPVIKQSTTTKELE